MIMRASRHRLLFLSCFMLWLSGMVVTREEEEVVDSDSKAKEDDKVVDKGGHEGSKEDLLEDKLDDGEEGKHVQVLLPQAQFEFEICIGIKKWTHTHTQQQQYTH